MLKLPKVEGMYCWKFNRSDGFDRYCVFNQLYDGTAVS